MKPLDICPICLRTERKLKSIATDLIAYYKEITNFCLRIVDPRYCSDCECLLKKTFNFHIKCQSAAKILNNWISIRQTKDKLPPNLLHQKLPPISLNTWKPDNCKVFTYNYSDDLETPAIIDESISGKPDIITIEDNISEILDKNTIEDNTSEILDKNTIRKRITKNTIGTISNTGLSENTNFEINKIRTSKNINYMTNQANTTSSCNMLKATSQPQMSYVVLVVDDIDGNKRNDNAKVNDTLKSINDMPKLQLTDNMLIPSGNIANSPQLMLNSTNNIPKRTNDYRKKTGFVKNPDMNVEITSLDHDYSKNDDVIVIDDETSLNSDEDVDDNYVSDIWDPDKKFTKNYLSAICLGSNITSKLETINETLDSICHNWEVSSLTDVGVLDVPNDKSQMFIRQYLSDNIKVSATGTTKYVKRSMEGKLVTIASDLDLINEKCGQVVDDFKNGMSEPKQRVKADLLRKVESWGELRAADGSVFDKDVVINSLDTAPERILIRLLRLLQSSNDIMPAATKCLRTIIRKQQLVKYESIFNIEYMTTEKEMLEEFERRKTYECYVKAKFKCEICYQGFEYEGGLHYHRKCHDESSPWSCPICHQRFELRRRRSYHMGSHEAVYKCKLCPLVTYYSSSMINHYEQHQGTLYKCEPCGTTYKSHSVYMSHQTRCHSRPWNVCTICGSTFVSSKGLNLHIRKKHPEGKPGGSGEFRCETCDLKFYSKHARSQHQRMAHKKKITGITRRKPIMTCRVCSKVGHSYGWMVFHFKTEHPTMDVRSLYAHRRVCLCHVCGKGFTNKKELARHIDYHNGIRFTCDKCGKSFPLEKALLYHQITHGPRAICCDRCGKKFRTKANLYTHMRIHIGDRRYKCGTCGKGFLHRSSLDSHIQGVHNQVRRVKKRGVIKTSRGVRDTPDGVTDTSVETGVYEVETGVCKAETGVYEDETLEYKEETVEYEEETVEYEDETVVYEDDTELCEDGKGGHGIAEIGAEVILDTETGEMRLVQK